MPANTTHHPPIDAPVRSSAPASAKRILIVDDDAQVLKLLRSFLCRWGYDVASADNGRSALALLGQSPCDLVITDLQMPVMDGFELLAVIKTASPRTPVVVFTGHIAEDAYQRRTLAAAFAVLVKPTPLSQLELVVRGALNA